MLLFDTYSVCLSHSLSFIHSLSNQTNRERIIYYLFAPSPPLITRSTNKLIRIDCRIHSYASLASRCMYVGIYCSQTLVNRNTHLVKRQSISYKCRTCLLFVRLLLNNTLSISMKSSFIFKETL